jgi:citrate lyase subunit beta/citryl-CoA lyase
VPGDRSDRFSKAATSGADAVFIDLEDAVAVPAKPQARDNLRTVQSLGIPTFVRVNASTTAWHADDIDAIGSLPLAGVILPKVQSADEIRAMRSKLGEHLGIIALVETAEGLANVRQIARADDAIRLAFGSIDFCADLGCSHTREALLFARTEIVLTSRLGGLLPPLDGVTAETDKPDIVESDARHAAELGFSGKLCIHPRQIKAAYDGFAPSESELAWALEILSVGDSGAVALNGQMIDPPVRRRAEALMARNGKRVTRGM